MPLSMMDSLDFRISNKVKQYTYYITKYFFLRGKSAVCYILQKVVNDLTLNFNCYIRFDLTYLGKMHL
jgi:hypothetical protein